VIGPAKKRVLDTTVVSALMKADPVAVERFAACARPDVLVPQPVVAEIRYGLARLPPSRRRTQLTSRLDLILEDLVRATWTDEVSEVFARVKAVLERAGTRLEDFDIAIAAHALAHGAILATANVRHMARIPSLEVEDWSE
jgi:tRNA(fMet)-specific endonuclease VapC